jgi:dipeptidase D
MGAEIKNLEPKLVWDYFYQLTKQPRPSKQEEKAVAWFESVAKNLNLPLTKDALGNLVITKEATPGMENRQAVVIQAHIDMVCEKNREVEFDFDNDAIQTWIDGDWVKAKGTTLGADNGIGLAMGLAVLASDDIPHPRLEILATLDEETGLTGAMELGTDLLKSDILINIDTEDDHVFSIGCAGGINTIGNFSYKSEDIKTSDYTFLEVGVKGMMGGHSGVEINEERANAAKLMVRMLLDLTNKFGIKISAMESGNKHNAIPREGFATIATKNSDVENVLKSISDFDATLKSEYSMIETNIEAFGGKSNESGSVMNSDDQMRILTAAMAVPHGIYRWSPDIEGLVQTSTNFAVIEKKDDHVHILTSQRSSVHSEKMYWADQIASVVKLAGGELIQGDGYPSWEPNMDSPILTTAKNIHKEMFGEDPVLEIIHAGLECGLVGEKYPNMDMLSFGPTIRMPHTPEEKVEISTVMNSWNLLKGILANIPVK